jgi:hypothetical protein
MAQYEIRARVTHTTRVLVEADSPEGAVAAFDDCEWKDDGMAGADLTDWELSGDPQEVR